MEINRIKKAIAILLVVLFLVTVTVGAASADKDYKLLPKESYPRAPTVLNAVKNFSPIANIQATSAGISY